jgi:cytochrome subunit of sulfide dehydrogenase
MTIKQTMLALALLALPAAASAVSPAPPGVAACSNCHPRSAGDGTLPPLAGRDAAQVVAAMTAFRDDTRPATVMNRIAKGFTDDEIAAIAAWYAAQQ